MSSRTPYFRFGFLGTPLEVKYTPQGFNFMPCQCTSIVIADMFIRFLSSIKSITAHTKLSVCFTHIYLSLHLCPRRNEHRDGVLQSKKTTLKVSGQKYTDQALVVSANRRSINRPHCRLKSSYREIVRNNRKLGYKFPTISGPPASSLQNM